jgi:hypothetical protein
VSTETVVVTGRGNRNAEEILILVNGSQNGAKEEKELGVFIRGFAGLKEIKTGVGGDRPVIMLTRAVNPLKGLFVEEAYEAVLGGYVAEHLHGQLIVVGGDVGGGENGSKLVLCGCRLVVLCF